MNLGIEGKNALVTGGSHGIGLGIAIRLAEAGCNIAICARDPVWMTKAIKVIKGMYNVRTMHLQCDVLEEGDIERTIGHILVDWSSIDILVNNVGGGGRWGSLDYAGTSLDVWDEVYRKNAGAAIRFTRGVIPNMVRDGWGRVVTIASIFGKEGGGRPWFNMAKSAEISLMKSLAMDKGLARAGITFNTVAPGPVMIEGTGWHKLREEEPEKFKEYVYSLPMARLGTADEVACMVAFLCSNRAKWVNGACVVVDGGQSASF